MKLYYTNSHSKDQLRQGGGSAGVYEKTLRKPTTMPIKLAEESELVLTQRPLFVKNGAVAL